MLQDHPIDQLLTLLTSNDDQALISQLEEMAVQDISEAISDAPQENRLRLFELLPAERRTDAFSYFSRPLQRAFIDELDPDEAKRILRELVPDDRTAFLESLDPQDLENFLKLLGPEDLKQSLKLLGYPEESVGRLMTPRFVAVRPDWSVARALDHIRQDRKSVDIINIVFVSVPKVWMVESLLLTSI